jgi:hypothetical protein
MSSASARSQRRLRQEGIGIFQPLNGWDAMVPEAGALSTTPGPFAEVSASPSERIAGVMEAGIH